MLREKIRAKVLIFIGLLQILIFYVNFLALNNVGQFLNRENMIAAVPASRSSTPELAGEYWSASSLIKVAIIIIAFIAAAVAIPRVASTLSKRRANIGAVSIGALMGLSLMTFLVGLTVTLPVPAAYKSATEAILAAMFRMNDPSSRFGGLDSNAIGRAFSDLTHTPRDGSVDPLFFGRAPRSNVVVFILETGPSRAFDPLRDKEVVEPVKELLASSFLAESHFSTYPYTSQAVFSIFSGLYPVNIRKRLLASQTAPTFGWTEALRQKSATRLELMPHQRIHLRMIVDCFHCLGLNNVSYPMNPILNLRLMFEVVSRLFCNHCHPRLAPRTDESALAFRMC